MPGPACLHIQARDEDPVRVVDLPGHTVRIGRAAACDVRLADPDLADEECRLRRRGATWQLHPAPAVRAVWLNDRPVRHPLPLPFGVSFRVGSHRLTLHPAGPASASWDDTEGTALAALGAGDGASGGEPGPVDARSDLSDSLKAEWTSRAEGHDRWLQAHRETRRWESRWRSAGEKLKTAAQRAPSPAVAAEPRPVPRPAPVAP